MFLPVFGDDPDYLIRDTLIRILAPFMSEQSVDLIKHRNESLYFWGSFICWNIGCRDEDYLVCSKCGASQIEVWYIFESKCAIGVLSRECECDGEREPPAAVEIGEHYGVIPRDFMNICDGYLKHMESLGAFPVAQDTMNRRALVQYSGQVSLVQGCTRRITSGYIRDGGYIFINATVNESFRELFTQQIKLITNLFQFGDEAKTT